MSLRSPEDGKESALLQDFKRRQLEERREKEVRVTAWVIGIAVLVFLIFVLFLK